MFGRDEEGRSRISTEYQAVTTIAAGLGTTN